MGSGFKGDDFKGERHLGLYMGTVIEREDPDASLTPGRVRVRIPGLIDDRSAWAKPKGGGAPQWGFIAVPPLNADIYVQFINGDIERPVWEPADFGVRDGQPERFPEYESPDMIVGGAGPFRMVLDLREDPAAGLKPSLTLKQVAKLQDGSETDTAWIRISENSIQVRGDSAVQITSGALTDIDSDGDVQVRRRKIMPASRPVR